MKLSFEEEYRRAMNELGGLQVVADLIHLDQDMYGMQNDPINMALRRYAGMAVTNLTFGDVVNKVQRTRRCGVNDSWTSDSCRTQNTHSELTHHIVTLAYC